MRMKASLAHFRQSPRKVRLIADMIRGKQVETARQMLAFADKKSAPAVKKLLESAIANARDTGHSTETLVVSKVYVDAGVVMKRFMPRARGSAGAIHKRTSRIHLELAETGGQKKTAKQAAPATTKKPAAKAVTKKAAVKKAPAKKTTKKEPAATK